MIKISAFCVVLAMATATPALAEVHGPASPVVALRAGPPPPLFDWQRPYVGAQGGYNFGGAYVDAGFQAGFAFLGDYLIGAEAEISFSIGGPYAIETLAGARIGYVLNYRVLFYGELGLGLRLPGGIIWTLSAGAELAVGSSLSTFAELRNVRGFGIGQVGLEAQLGVNWRLPRPQ